MFGSIYVGLSGLNAYSRGLHQVSNNVTNINSPGFKGSAVSFTDLVSYSGSPGVAGSGDGYGGGNGVALGETRLDLKQGELRQTERDLDLAVEGNGFLMLLKGEEVLYTRTGSFEVNPDGFIVLSGTDYRLATLDGSGRPVSLSLASSNTSRPQQTTSIRFSDNLSSGATSFGVGDLKVYDRGGAQHVWQVQFAKSGAATNEWTVTVTDDKARTIGSSTLKFTETGAVDPSTQTLLFGDAAAGLEVALDFSNNVTSFSSGSVSTLGGRPADGYGPGATTSVGVNNGGRIEIGYSNGQKSELGAIALADFREPQALTQRGGGLFAETGQGRREVMTSEDQRVGRVMSRRLEASNVDLAKQFGELILIQRGFQASSQIISVSNDMIQQLFGIRGQG
ncbi:MAG TPA: flagellar hook-basal body complex protein [Allosphingosinicella sp.]|jgi:flagellar hook protein FlgE